MKNKILIILLFILFAIPFLANVLGFVITFAWFLKSLIYVGLGDHILVALIGVLISATYPLSYVFALWKSWKEDKITVVTFLPVAHCLVSYIYLLLLLRPAR